jgi:adenosylcobinamide-GDP ribazoletransferase
VIAGELRAAAAAAAFLTRVPIRAAFGERDIARAVVAFPLVGAAVGAATGGITLGLAHYLPDLLAALLAVGAGAILTGALHLDALADTADAFGARTRERALEIMRDHAVGAFGALALVLAVAIHAEALAALVRDGDVVRSAVAAGAVSRAAPAVLGATLPYARTDGTGRPLAGGRLRAVVAVAIALAIAVAVGQVWLAVTAAAVVAAVGLAARRLLGGFTGDVLGAAVVLAELGALVVAVGLAQ